MMLSREAQLLRHARPQAQWRPFTGVAPSGCRLLCRAAAPELQAVPASSLMPDTPQQAVKEAVAAATARLKPRMQSGKAPAKGFSATPASEGAAGTGRDVLHIEIPVADTSSGALAQLAVDVVASFLSKSGLSGSAAPVMLVFADAKAAKAAQTVKGKPTTCKVLELREACRLPRLEGGLLLVAAPAISDVALCEQLALETWSGKGVVLLNAAFLSSASPATLGLPADLQSFVESVTTVWCLMPVAIKGLLGDMHGVVLHRGGGAGKKGAAAGQPVEPWRILMRQMGPKGQDVYVQIGQTKRRPSSDDLQLAFINANAASSPLTKAMAGARSMFDGLRGGGNKGGTAA